MEFKGTKGKWKLTYTHKDKPGIDAINENGQTYKTVVLFGEKSDDAGIINTGIEQKANALLISKAPEMLDMLDHLQSLMEYLDEWKEEREGILKLIKEATEI